MFSESRVSILVLPTGLSLQHNRKASLFSKPSDVCLHPHLRIVSSPWSWGRCPGGAGSWPLPSWRTFQRAGSAVGSADFMFKGFLNVHKHTLTHIFIYMDSSSNLVDFCNISF